MPRKRLLAVLKKKVPRARSQGAQCGNENALIHGFYADLNSRNLDGRSILAKALRAVEAELVAALGGDLSPQEKILVDRAVYKVAKCSIYEAASFSETPSNSDEKYLAWANSLRLDLQTLGLRRRVKSAMDLREYLEKKS